MANAHYFYLPLTVKELEDRVQSHQENFEEFLKDTFSDKELTTFEGQVDSIAAIFVQPIISELSFQDFYSNASDEQQQKQFFETCRSSICLENLPDFHSNPFQVSYLIQLLENFHEVLIDQGGVEELVFKAAYIDLLKNYKSVDSMISSPLERPPEVKTTKPVYPIDFLILDVYKEIDRLKTSKQIYNAIEQATSLPEKTQKILTIASKDLLDSITLLKRTGLNPKDFDDNLERLKFFLKKIY
ncbi:MAG TPA: hypothetical protein VNJ08_17815 [Bacteriovoracaceae bacterium]|nr:hypothetical protein [Bacteriovoracaceae bacterium]